MKLISILAAALAIALTTPVLADCQAELEAIDQRLATADLQPPFSHSLKTMRDQGASHCAAGNETSAGAAFKSVAMMLDTIATANAQKAQQAPAPAVKTADPTPATLEDMLDSATKPGDFLPYVVVTDAGVAESLDWDELRRLTGTNYPNRWDDLTMLNICLWISADALAKRLGLEVRLEARQQDVTCKYWAHLPDGSSGIILSVYAELWDTPERPREYEAGRTSNLGKLANIPYDAGASDLNIYVGKKAKSINAFPEGGRSFWFITYGVSYGMEDVYKPDANAGIEQDIGPIFMTMLVEKYGNRL